VLTVNHLIVYKYPHTKHLVDFVYFEIVVVLEDMLLEGLYIFFFWGYLNDLPSNADALT
jgi:hypothetical protein